MRVGTMGGSGTGVEERGDRVEVTSPRCRPRPLPACVSGLGPSPVARGVWRASPRLSTTGRRTGAYGGPGR